MEARPQLTPEELDEKYRRTMRQYHLSVLAACAAVLVVSLLLTPDPRGHGTHEHLYLPPCGLYYLTNIRCPFCGLTTSFVHTMHLELGKAFEAHPAGPPLVLIFAAQIPFRLLLLAGKELPLIHHPNASLWAWRAVLCLAILGWLVRLVIYGP